jgi:hypothetical protein
MTTGLPTPPAAPTGLSNGQITEGESLLPHLSSFSFECEGEIGEAG